MYVLPALVLLCPQKSAQDVCSLCCHSDLLQVVCVDDGMPSWVCEVCVTKPTVRQAIHMVKQVEHELRLPIKAAK